jgi:hypothetical protein
MLGTGMRVAKRNFEKKPNLPAFGRKPETRNNIECAKSTICKIKPIFSFGMQRSEFCEKKFKKQSQSLDHARDRFVRIEYCVMRIA